jgi:hypothetical protein
VTLDSRPIYGTIILLAFVGCVVTMMWHPPATTDPNTLAMVNMMLGALAAMANYVVQNSFGSSRGSEAKDETISKLAGAGSTGDPATGTTTTTSTSTTAPPLAPLPKVVPAASVSGKPASVFGEIK